MSEAMRIAISHAGSFRQRPQKLTQGIRIHWPIPSTVEKEHLRILPVLALEQIAPADGFGKERLTIAIEALRFVVGAQSG